MENTLKKSFINKSLENSKKIMESIISIDVNKNNLGRKVFDNIVWVIILVAVLFISITAYLSTNSFNNSYIISELDKKYKGKINLNDLTIKTEGEDVEEFDEIDPNKNNLCDVYISSSRRSYLIGRQLFDFCSKDIIMKILKMGARFIELDLYLSNNNQIVIANGLSDGKWIFTLNSILFKDFMKTFSENLFDPNTFQNPNDPILLFLNINIPKTNCEELYQIIKKSIGKNLASQEYNLEGGKNILETPLIKLMNKVILMTSGKIGDTKLMELVHLRLGDRVRRMTFKQVFESDQNDMINFNKKHLTIVVPENGIRALNFNPERAFDYGCQIVALHFQRMDNNMEEYISKFNEKSFQLKPFEFTRFADIPQKGYDKDKIAYYDTYNDDELITLEKPCREITDSKECEQDRRCYFDNPKCYDKKEPCCNYILDIENEDFNDIDIGQLRMKLKQFNIKEHYDILEIDKLTPSDEAKLTTYIDKHIFDESTKQQINNNKENLIKYIIKKQLKIAVEKEKRKVFDIDFKDTCFGKDKFSCDKEKMCLSVPNSTGKRCKRTSSKLPFPNLCLPRDILPTHNSCPNKNSELGKKIHNKPIRGLLHKKHTDYEQGFAGNWSAIGGIIEIENKYNQFCEFKFTTPTDNKQFTMVIVKNDDGKSINFQNMNQYSYQAGKITNNFLRAKGTFIDPEIRKIEEIYNIPPLKFHGYADIEMLPYNSIKVNKELIKEERNISNQNIEKCFDKDNNLNQDVIFGLYQYSDNVIKLIDKNNDKFKYFIDKFDVEKLSLNDTYILSSYKRESDIKDKNKLYAYRMLDPGCNRQLQKMFGREIITTLSDAIEPKGYFDPKQELPKLEIENFTNMNNKSFINHYKRNLVEEFQPNLSKADILSKTIFGIKPPKDGIKANELTDDFFSDKITKSKFNKLSKENRLLYASLNRAELDYAKQLDIDKLLLFLAMSDEQKLEEIFDLYETPKPKRRKIPVDLIHDDSKQKNTCLIKNYYEAESCYIEPLSSEQRKKQKKRAICNIPQCDFKNPYVTPCTEDKYEQPPYCSTPYSKWIISKNEGEKNQQISLVDEDEGNKCELNDSDYQLNEYIENNPNKILELQIKKREINVMNEPPGYKEKVEEIDKKIEVKQKELSTAQQGQPSLGKKDAVGKIPMDGALISSLSNDIKKLKKEKQELLPKIKEDLLKPINDYIKLLEKQIEDSKKEIEIRKKNNTYSEPSSKFCLGYGKVKTGSKDMFIPKVLYCDKRRNYHKIKDFDFKWKVIEIPNQKGKFIIKSNKGNMCLTKLKLKSSDDDEDDDQPMTNLLDSNYFRNIGSGKYGIQLGMEKCELDLNVSHTKKKFGKNYTEAIIAGSKLVDINFIHETIMNYDNIFYLKSGIGIQYLKTYKGLDFILSDKGEEFLKSELGKKILKTSVGKQISKTKSIIKSIINEYKFFIKDGKIVDCVGEGGTDRCLNFIFSNEGLKFLRTKKGEEFMETKQGKSVIIDPRSIQYFNTDEGINFLDSNKDILEIVEKENKNYNDSNHSIFRKEIDKMNELYLENKNPSNYSKFVDFLKKPEGIYFLSTKDGLKFLNSKQGLKFLKSADSNNFLKSPRCLVFLLSDNGIDFLNRKEGRKVINTTIFDTFILKDIEYKFLDTKEGSNFLKSKNGENFLKGDFGSIFMDTEIGKRFLDTKDSTQIKKSIQNKSNQNWQIETIPDINICEATDINFDEAIQEQGSKQKGTTTTDKNKKKLEEDSNKPLPKEKELPKKEPDKRL